LATLIEPAEVVTAADSVSGAVAQLVAHLHGMEGVRGSSPLSSTNSAVCGPRDREDVLG
jgi:hypothetical protein